MECNENHLPGDGVSVSSDGDCNGHAELSTQTNTRERRC